MKHIILALIIICTSTQTIAAGGSKEEEKIIYGPPHEIYVKKAEYSSLIQDIQLIIKKNKFRIFNGIIMIAKNNDVIYSLAHGPYSKPQLNSQFYTTNIAEQITATLILDQADDGIIDLHQPIKKYLPKIKDIWAKKVTIHH